MCLTLLDVLYCYLEDWRHEDRQTSEDEDKDTSDSLFPEEETITKITIFVFENVHYCSKCWGW